jgi:hypothetical protein
MGAQGKKYLLISLGIVQGLLSLGLGMYIDGCEHPSRKRIFPVPSQDTDSEHSGHSNWDNHHSCRSERGCEQRQFLTGATAILVSTISTTNKTLTHNLL